MRDIIERIFQSLKEEDTDQYVDIFFSVQAGETELLLEDIVPLCRMLTYDFEYIECSQTEDIIKMTFWAINNSKMEDGLKELIKGLEDIHSEIQKGTKEDWDGEFFLYQFILGFVYRYEKEDIVLFGRLISESSSSDFKVMMLKTLKWTMKRKEDDKEYVMKGKVLADNISL